MPNSFYVYDQYIYAAAALIGTFMGCWLLLWLMLRPAGQGFTKPFASVAPPFMNILGVLFALTLAFIGNDTWTAHDRAVRAVNAEADRLRGLAIIIRSFRRKRSKALKLRCKPMPAPPSPNGRISGDAQ